MKFSHLIGYLLVWVIIIIGSGFEPRVERDQYVHTVIQL
jgi:hypothetical protein